MYDSGSQYAELTLCLPSPMLFLLNLQDMKLVNSSTALRYCLKRNDNSANIIPTGGERESVCLSVCVCVCVCLCLFVFVCPSLHLSVCVCACPYFSTC